MAVKDGETLMTKFNYEYICRQTGAAVPFPDAFVFDPNFRVGRWNVISSGDQSITVPAGTFTTKWIKVILYQDPQRQSYETRYLVLFRGRPIIIKKVTETDGEFRGEFYRQTQDYELISLPNL